MRFSRILWGCFAPINKMSARKLLDEQVLDFGFVSRRNGTRIAEVPLLLRRLFGEDMAMVSVFPLDFSGAGEVEALLGSGICFHLWHLYFPP